MSRSIKLILFLAVFIFGISTLVIPVAGTDHIVGVNKGWNPGINYTLWSNNQTFYVGDFISFRYQKAQYNVFEVNQTGYENCTTEGSFGNWTSGKDFILLTEAKRYYFIGGNGQCFLGMKVSVIVHLLPSPPSSSIGKTNSSSDSPSPHVVNGNWFLSLVATIWVVGIGFI